MHEVEWGDRWRGSLMWLSKVERLEELLTEQGWFGTDANPAASLLEYGFVLRKVSGYDEWDVIAQVPGPRHRPPKFYTSTLTWSALEWAQDMFAERAAKRAGLSTTDWRENVPLAHRIADLVRLCDLLDDSHAGSVGISELIDRLKSWRSW